MITLNQLDNPSAHVRKRAKNCWVRTLAPDTYAVKPKEKGKPRRVVRFVQTAAGIKIECRDKATGESCPANAFKVPCSHIEAAVNRLMVNLKRQANKQEREQREAK